MDNPVHKKMDQLAKEGKYKEIEKLLKDEETTCYVCNKQYSGYNTISLSRWVEDHPQPLVDICVDCMVKMFEKVGYPFKINWLTDEWLLFATEEYNKFKNKSP